MTTRKIVLVFAVLSIAAAAAAPTDRTSGKWGSDGQTLLDLKFDGIMESEANAYSADGGIEPRERIYAVDIRAALDGPIAPEHGPSRRRTILQRGREVERAALGVKR